MFKMLTKSYMERTFESVLLILCDKTVVKPKYVTCGKYKCESSRMHDVHFSFVFHKKIHNFFDNIGDSKMKSRSIMKA